MKRLIRSVLPLFLSSTGSCTATQPEPTKTIQPAALIPATVSIPPSRSCTPRATFYIDEDRRYRYVCDTPEHIRLHIPADGYRTIGVNSYHPNGQTEGIFDIVLQPE